MTVGASLTRPTLKSGTPRRRYFLVLIKKSPKRPKVPTIMKNVRRPFLLDRETSKFVLFMLFSSCRISAPPITIQSHLLVPLVFTFVTGR